MKILTFLLVFINLRVDNIVTDFTRTHSQPVNRPLTFLATPVDLDFLLVSIQFVNMDSKDNPSDISDASRFNCGTCDRTVAWDQKGIACETCGLWYHASCQSIGGKSYEDLGTSDMTWHCVVCGNPNYSNIAFDLYSLHNETSTKEPSLMANPNNTTIPPLSPDGNFKPIHASTPTRASLQDKFNTRPIRLLNVNFRSVIGSKPELLNLIDSLRPDIIIGTETWLDKTIKNEEFMPSNYCVHRKDRNREGGGVLIAVRSEMQSTVNNELDTDCEILWAKIMTEDKRNLHVCAYYRPKTSDIESLDKFEISLRRAASTDSRIVIAGDLNFPDWDWNKMTLKDGAKYPALHTRFVDLLHDVGMEQMVTEPTRKNNTLDLVITNTPQLVPRVEVVKGISDHDIVLL